MITRIFKNPNNITTESLEAFRRITADWGIPNNRAQRWYYQLHYPDGQITTVHNAKDAKSALQEKPTNHILISLRSTGGSFVEFDSRNRSRVSCTVSHSIGDDTTFLGKLVSAFKLLPMPPSVFLTHGRGDDWRHVKAFIENDVGISLRAIELAEQPHGGSAYIGSKFETYAAKCACAVIIMSGDDKAYNPNDTEELRVRENVIHELGYFQACLGADRVILLKETGVNIPSNILGRGYIPYSKGHIAEVDTKLRRELIEIFN
ncbi:TIR domain-containing protein [Roseimaritima ulvae]|nr:nucleotide-binding protein [Roseimaritima ulvae]